MGVVRRLRGSVVWGWGVGYGVFGCVCGWGCLLVCGCVCVVCVVCVFCVHECVSPVLSLCDSGVDVAYD